MSDKVSSAENQQGTPKNRLCDLGDSSETTRRAPNKAREIQVYLLGAIHDGTFSTNRRFRISQKGTEWLLVLKKLFKELGYNSWIYKEGQDRDVYILETLAKFLDFKFNPLNCKTKEEKQGYIRGFFDAEGGIPRNRNERFYIQLVQKNRGKLEKLKKMLEELSIQTGKIHNPSKRVDPEYWRMYVSADSRALFVNMIGSWHPRKIRTLAERVKI